jgi:hypothetical protein
VDTTGLTAVDEEEELEDEGVGETTTDGRRSTMSVLELSSCRREKERKRKEQKKDQENIYPKENEQKNLQ